jgi:hypothetical protein
MLLRQQFVALPGITEVQWNQRLLVFGVILSQSQRTQIHGFAAKKAFAGASRSGKSPAK